MPAVLGAINQFSVSVVLRQLLKFYGGSFVPVMDQGVRAGRGKIRHPGLSFAYLSLFHARAAGQCLTMGMPVTATAVCSRAVIQ